MTSDRFVSVSVRSPAQVDRQQPLQTCLPPCGGQDQAGSGHRPPKEVPQPAPQSACSNVWQKSSTTRTLTVGLMRYIAALFLAFPLAVAGAPSATDWLPRVPESAGTWRDWQEISEREFFEVPASRLGAVEARLSEVPYLLQEPSDMGYFGRAGFKCSAPERPYLVRALYVNGGTGRFDLMWTKGSALVVAHASLGPGGPAIRSAIITCLPHEPSAIFSSISGAL